MFLTLFLMLFHTSLIILSHENWDRHIHTFKKPATATSSAVSSARATRQLTTTASTHPLLVFVKPADHRLYTILCIIRIIFFTAVAEVVMPEACVLFFSQIAHYIISNMIKIQMWTCRKLYRKPSWKSATQSAS